MKPRLLMLTTITGLIMVLLGIIPNSVCQNDDTGLYETCSRPFECGNTTDIGYPFWGDGRPESCGYPGFQLNCVDNNTPRLNISPISYQVLDIDYSTQTLRVARDDLLDGLCAPLFLNTTLNINLSTADDLNITLYYGCRPIPPPALPLISPYQFSCRDTLNLYFTAEAISGLGNNVNLLSCDNIITVPVNRTAALALANPATTSPAVLEDVLTAGFSIQWWADNDNCNSCTESGGLCGCNPDSGSFACYCRNGSQGSRCNDAPNQEAGSNSSNVGRNVGLFIGGGVVAGVGVGWLIFYYRQRRKQRLQQRLGSQPAETASEDISKPLSTPPSTTSALSFTTSNSDLGRGISYFGVQVFSYAQLEEATHNFDPSRVIGDGGFGTVYYGVLPGGHIVAVKRLYDNNFKRVEQFMNEVEILTRLRHKNLVTLHGCTSKRSRELLLVYEYIPNGTVADHLHGRRAKSGLLSWPVRLNIAIETADALDYLHKSDIIHRDVKTNNILLDNDFHVKVADFGISRLFPTGVTHVSTAPQGTPGYVDPEYYQCYQLTEKSDVYSFGVVLIELISSLQAVDTDRHRHDINLANMAVNKIQNHTLHELVDSSLGFETNSTVRRMATLVAELAFRCLQQERDMRPSMEQVLEGLRGIQNEELNAHKVEVVDLLIDDDTGPLKGSVAPPSPDSASTEKWASGSAPNSSG
ncbi:probable serine/threonine-protein kinase at1g18390 [Phtheirospermum japonicum]|uniref:non-specific serine/threonine protein kinase n=1 Tax=Phtheirospermum japonicum TaxID=374723 RepID=A0A830CCQ7_9LAMI|nr:probable serine/threonine-protein kinase at1g18390 [Phtheirospermum japonicum]